MPGKALRHFAQNLDHGHCVVVGQNRLTTNVANGVASGHGPLLSMEVELGVNPVAVYRIL